jgi:predicted RND superfamily exporter protein
MLNFFEKRDPWGNGYALWVVVILAFLLPVIVTSIRQTRLENEVESWLPKDDPQAKMLAWYRGHFEDSDRFFVTWDSSTLDDPRILALQQELVGFVDDEGIRREASHNIEAVVIPQDIIHRMLDLKVAPDDALQRLQGVILGHGPLKVKLVPDSHTPQDRVIVQLKSAIKDALDLDVQVIPHPMTTWSDNDGKLEEYLAERDRDIASRKLAAADIPVPPLPEHNFQLTWHGFRPDSDECKQVITIVKNLKGRTSQSHPEGAPLVEDCFMHAGAPVAMIIDLSSTGTQNRKEAIADVISAAKRVQIPTEELHLGGRPIGAETLNQAVKKSIWNTDVPLWKFHERSIVLLSGLVGIILSFISLRSIPLALMVLTVSYYTTMATVALVPITGGTMNMVLIVMPSLLFVLTLSGAIHIVNYWKHAVRKGEKNPVSYAVSMAWLPCSLAGITTALGLLSLLTSPLSPVREFGVYSAAGCLLSLAMVLVALPSMLQLYTINIERNREHSSRFLAGYSDFLCKYHVPFDFICICSLLAAGYGLLYFKTETKVIKYFKPDARIVQDYNYLEENITGVNQVDVVVRFTALPDGSNEENETQFLERMEIVRRVQDKVRSHPEISGAISLADFFPINTPPDKDASFLARSTFNKKSYETEAKIKDGGAGQASAFLAVAKETRDLEKPGDQALCRVDDELWRITAQASVTANNDYGMLINELDELIRSELKFHPQSHHFVTGMVPVFLRTQQAVLDSLISSFALAYAMIAVVMMITLRSVVGGFIAMLPNIWPVGFIFGLISWSGWKVDIGTMVTASVALGIAVDGTLHLITWFQDGLKSGLSRNESIKASLVHCAPAMVQTSAIVALGLLVLSPSDLLLISRFGILMAALIFAALIADIVYMPVILAGPLGRFLMVKSDPKSSPSPVKFAEEIETDASDLLQGPHTDFPGNSPISPVGAGTKNSMI